MSIDQSINNIFAPLSDIASSVVLYSVPVAGQDVKLLLVWLAAAALFFTLYFGFINIRYFKHGIDIILGKFDKSEDVGQINSWQALMASMSGTVGLGNIAGVAVAVSLGGPGAVFWMIVLGFFSMSTKFAEVTLGVKYRKTIETPNGTTVVGGPIYYLEEALGQFGWPKLGKALAVFFAICCILGSIGGANIFQSNQAFQQLYVVTGGEQGIMDGKGWLFGIVMAALVGIVIIGGIKSIAQVASRLVPFMAAIYIVAALFVITMNSENIIPAIQSIFTNAFSMQAGISGLLGAMLVGFQRAAFSNESGLGTAAIVYPAAKAHEPISQGIASMLGPFLDTIVICTITALMILISGAYDPNTQIQGVELTSNALAAGASWLPLMLSIIVFLFAYSTMITFAYTSSKCVAYLSNHNPIIHNIYNGLYCLLAVVGASSSLNHVIDFTDSVFLSMAIPNILGLFLLAPLIKKELKAYEEQIKNAALKTQNE